MAKWGQAGLLQPARASPACRAWARLALATGMVLQLRSTVPPYVVQACKAMEHGYCNAPEDLNFEGIGGQVLHSHGYCFHGLSPKAIPTLRDTQVSLSGTRCGCSASHCPAVLLHCTLTLFLFVLSVEPLSECSRLGLLRACIANLCQMSPSLGTSSPERNHRHPSARPPRKQIVAQPAG